MSKLVKEYANYADETATTKQATRDLSLGTRAYGLFLDVVLGLLVCSALYTLDEKTIRWKSDFDEGIRPGIWWTVAITVVVLVLNRGLLQAFTGRSVGKMIVGSRLETSEGSKPRLGSVFVRVVTDIFAPIEGIYLLATKQTQRRPDTQLGLQVVGEGSRVGGGSSPRRKRAFLSVALLLLFALPWINPALIRTDDTDFAGLLAGFVVPFVLLALGLNVVVGMAGLLDLGYVGFFAVGAYTVGILTSKHATWPWLIAMVLAVVVSMLFGVILGAPTLRLRGDYLAIVTLGFGEIIRITAQNVKWLGAAEGISGIKRPPSIGPLKFTVLENKGYWVFGVVLIILVISALALLEDSRVGRAWSAIREDEDAAELMGVPTFVFKLWAFAIGAAVGGLAGAFYAGKLNTIYPRDFEIAKSILFLAAVVMGGLGNRWGAVVGGALVAYLPERFRFVGDKRFMWFGLVLMFMMLFRPEGLLPRKLAKRREHAGPGNLRPPRSGAKGGPQ
jgi:branched-chain amino acid transport system permease protein